MAEFVEAGRLEELPLGRGTTVTISNKEVALFNVAGTVYAMDDSCLHHGVSLGNSNLEGKIVTCRGHGWRYDVTTGRTLNVPGCGVASYPVKIVNGKIMVAVEQVANPTG